MVFPEDMVFYDVSQFRQVPDNQEVFVEANEQSMHGDRSIIFEIVQLPTATLADSDAITRYYWEDYAKENCALLSPIHSVEKLPLTHFASDPMVQGDNFARITGTHLVPVHAKGSCLSGTGTYNRQNVVGWKPAIISCGVIRLPRVEADILISFHIPGPPFTSQEGFLRWNESGAVRQDVAKCSGIIDAVIDSFRIHDWNLFKEECN